MSEKFPKSERILKSRDYKKTLDSGRKFVTRSFVLFSLSEALAPRMGLIVSKRVGNAVERNRIKRIVREWFRTSKIKPKGDLVVLARSDAARIPSSSLTSELNGLIEKMKLSQQ